MDGSIDRSGLGEEKINVAQVAQAVCSDGDWWLAGAWRDAYVTHALC
jgi:hypothetical protein